MYSYYFRIADLLVCIHTPIVFNKFYELDHYRIKHINGRKADIEYKVCFFNEEWKVHGRKVQEVRRTCVYETEDSFLKYYFWSVHTNEKFVILEQKKEEYYQFKLYIPYKDIDSLLREFHISAFLSMERALLKYSAFQLHASVISWNGKGILFSAPSGTGKSTQAEMWKKYESAAVVNGDRAIIRKQGNKFRAYGSPYAGTSGVYTNISVPVGAIVILEQGKENHIKRLGGIEAFKKIYSESTICTWDQMFIEKYMDLLGELIRDVSVYYLSCRPEKRAVELLKEWLLSESGI